MKDVKIKVGETYLGLVAQEDHLYKRDWRLVKVLSEFEGSYAVVDLSNKSLKWCVDFKEAGERTIPHVGEVWRVCITSGCYDLVVVNSVSGFLVKGVNLDGKPTEFTLNTMGVELAYGSVKEMLGW